MLMFAHTPPLPSYVNLNKLTFFILSLCIFLHLWG